MELSQNRLRAISLAQFTSTLDSLIRLYNSLVTFSTIILSAQFISNASTSPTPVPPLVTVVGQKEHHKQNYAKK